MRVGLTFANMRKDHPLVSLNLLIFALETAVTTLTCVVDISAWEPYTAKQKIDLYSIYVPYFVLGKLLWTGAGSGARGAKRRHIPREGFMS